MNRKCYLLSQQREEDLTREVEEQQLVIEALKTQNSKEIAMSPSNRKHRNYIQVLEERVEDCIADSKRYLQKYVEMRALAY